jgi:hypothetical protein
MQIVEVSVTGVRSAVLRLRRHGSPLRFVLYPMVHIAEPAFYAAVTERLRGCDLVVAEGVGGDSIAVSALTATYQVPARWGDLGLVEQNIDFAGLGIPVCRPDLTGEEFAEAWRAVPLWQRAMAMTAAPAVALNRLVFGSRRALARQMEETDLDWQDRALYIESKDDLLALLTDVRDRRLLEALDEIHRQRSHEEITVAIVYGAAHVAPVVHGLRSLHGYGVRSAEWLTVFGF